MTKTRSYGADEFIRAMRRRGRVVRTLGFVRRRQLTVEDDAMAVSTDRQVLANRLNEIGIPTEKLRQELCATGKPYIGGLLRSAEETLSLVKDILTNPDVPESEL